MTLRRVGLLVAGALFVWCPAVHATATASTPILGTIPPYPGATRPLKQLETKFRAIALTTDKPEAVIAYYMHGLVQAGWTPAPEMPREVEAAKAGQPAWLTFTRRAGGRLDIQVATGRHPQTGKRVTLITYEFEFKP